jgi:phosphoglycerate dehydrogenase-like enzyme
MNARSDTRALSVAGSFASGARVRLRVIGSLPPDYLDRICAAWPEAVLTPAPDADACLVWDYFADPVAALDGTDAPQWIHVRSAAVDPRLLPFAAERLLTNGSGAHGPAVAEHVIALLLAVLRRVPDLMADKASARWREPFFVTELRGRSALVIGTGDVGGCTARLLSAFGATVTGVNRSGSPADGFASVRPAIELPALLPRCHVLVIAVPVTDHTLGLIGRAELDLLPRDAVVVNVARGAILDEAGLIDALRAGALGGACLDVFAAEPLPPSSALWGLPNVIISPHCADSTPETEERCLAGFLDNVASLRAGCLPRRIVDPDRGY